MPRMVPGLKALAASAACALCMALHASARGDDAADKASDPLERIRALNRITGSDPIKTEARLLSGKADETRKFLKEAVELVKTGKTPLTYSAAFTLAQAASRVNDGKAAEFFYRRCISQAVALKSSGRLRQAYGGLIDYLYENKKYAESARLCRELLELKTGDGKERIVVFTVTTRFGETDFVEDNRFDSAKGIRPLVHHLLIQAVTKQGKYEQALKLVENLVKAKNHWLEIALKGWVLKEAGKLQEAAKVYENALDRVGKDKDLDQEDRDSYQDNYRYILSGIYVDIKKIDQASEQLQTLLAKNPEDPGFNNDLGYIWADHDMKLEEAEKLIRKALELDRKRRKANPKIPPELDRDNGAYLDSLGWVLYKRKMFKEAKDALLKAVQDKAAQHIEIYDHLGDVLMALGERDAAIKAWRRGVELATDSRRDQVRRVAVEKKLEMHK